MTDLIILGLVAVVGATGLLVFRRSPRLAFTAWTFVLCFAPYWTGADVGVFVTATSVVGALAVASLYSSRRPRVGAVDLLVIVIVIVYVLGTLVGGATIATGFVLIAHWGIGYLLGRTVAAPAGFGYIYDVVAVAFTVVAVLAVVEFVTGVNVFHLIRVDNSAYSAWSGQQFRGGNPRAEGAFGHSIALGCSLAMSIPMVIASRFREGLRAVMVVVILSGTVVTFSRTSMICAFLSLVLSVVFLKGAIPLRTRVALLVGATAVAVTVGPLVISTFAEAGTEATGSSAYRGDLLSLVPTMQPLGLSSAAYRSASGEFYFGSFRSIDSALILLGLTHGLISLAIVLVLLGAAVILVVTGRAAAPTISVVAQIPALATVALITQYGVFFWVVCGIAVASQLARTGGVDPADDPAASDDSLPRHVRRRHAPPLLSTAGGPRSDARAVRRERSARGGTLPRPRVG